MITRLLKWWHAFVRRHTYVTVSFTQDRSLYYVNRHAPARRASFSVMKHPLPPPSLASNGSIDGWFKSAIIIQKDDGEGYWREVYPFVFYKLPSHRLIERVRADDDLVIDYEMDTERFLAKRRSA